jgi:hypothetical protein
VEEDACGIEAVILRAADTPAPFEMLGEMEITPLAELSVPEFDLPPNTDPTVDNDDPSCPELIDPLAVSDPVRSNADVGAAFFPTPNHAAPAELVIVNKLVPPVPVNVTLLPAGIEMARLVDPFGVNVLAVPNVVL